MVSGLGSESPQQDTHDVKMGGAFTIRWNKHKLLRRDGRAKAVDQNSSHGPKPLYNTPSDRDELLV